MARAHVTDQAEVTSLSDPLAWGQILRAAEEVAFAGLACDRSLPSKTDTIPSSPEKLAVLCQRYRAGLALWNPADPRIERDESGTLYIVITIDVDRNGAVINRRTNTEEAAREAEEQEDSFADEIAADMEALTARLRARAALIERRQAAA